MQTFFCSQIMQKPMIMFNIVTNSCPTLKELPTALMLYSTKFFHSSYTNSMYSVYICTFINHTYQNFAGNSKHEEGSRGGAYLPTMRSCHCQGTVSGCEGCLLSHSKESHMQDTWHRVAASTFYTFNMPYPEDCNNIYSFFEAALLAKSTLGRRLTLQQF